MRHLSSLPALLERFLLYYCTVFFPRRIPVLFFFSKKIRKNAKAMLSGFFGKLDLVTREEFDVQAQVLARTREKLQALEARVDALEKARSGQ